MWRSDAGPVESMLYVRDAGGPGRGGDQLMVRGDDQGGLNVEQILLAVKMASDADVAEHPNDCFRMIDCFWMFVFERLIFECLKH